MIRAVVFDYDGVITAGVDDTVIPARLAQSLDISTQLASEWLATIWSPFMKAEITENEVWSLFEAKYQKPITQDQRSIWLRWEELVPLPEMLDLVKALKSQSYSVGILSNVFEPTRELIRVHGGYDGYDFTVLSSEVGCKKPDADIFGLVQQKLSGLAFTEMIFLDDREASIITARGLGVNAIHVKDHSAAIKQVRELLK